MEDIKDVVHSIVRGCEQTGIHVPEVLAAFVARTVVEANAQSFALDRKITPELLDQVILQSIEKLLEKDNPALETMKMQVDYDSSFLSEDSNARKAIRLRYKLLVGHKTSVVEVEMEDVNDFESLTTCYRKIFKFLLDFAPNVSTASKSGSITHDRAVEREVAAALESVFPRIGLKAFVQLNGEEKNVQLAELARIVLGIRLYNRDQGRGGAGIEDNDKQSLHLATAMLQDIDREVEFFADACNKYQTAIVRANLRNRRIEIEKRALEESCADDKLSAQKLAHLKSHKPPVSPYLINRWVQELSNRRQYLTFLRTLQDEIHLCHQKIAQYCDNVGNELTNIKTLISNKASVPKEVIYPRFDSLGNIWVQLYEEALILHARSNTFRTLCKYRTSFNHTLAEEYYADTATAADLAERDLIAVFGSDSKKRTKAPTAESKQQPSPIADAKGSPEDKDGMKEDSKLTDTAGSGSGVAETADAKNSEESLAEVLVDSVQSAEVMDEQKQYDTGIVPTLLSVHNTPDFMLLPLELQGYCPWTLVHAKGLLIPGKPALGVIRYENAYYVCDHEIAVRDFMKYPEYYLKKLRERVLQSPEYIHLLRIQQWFPTASIAKLLESPDFDPTTGTGGGKQYTKEVGTSTPTHFVEKNIDQNYHWNEWELRRRALKIVNLKNCATHSSQTDSSHFRRDNESQVYETREKDSQTRRDNFTNPPVKTQVIAGLRGALPPKQTAHVSKFLDYNKYCNPEAKPDKYGNKPRAVTLTLDL